MKSQNKINPEEWAKISDLFEKIGELDKTKQKAQLRKVAKTDPELAQAVAKMLEADAKGMDLFDHGLTKHTKLIERSLAESKLVEEELAHKPGKEIGPFRLEYQLGKGGMGEVWLAYSQDQMDREPVAIKLLRPGYASNDAIQRFSQEQRILEKLQHPNIARLVSTGTTGGQPWIAMQYIQGKSITEYAQHAELGVAERLKLIIKICDAVDFAHSHLIIHRDIKPGNLLVDKEGHPYLLDFGIAKLLQRTKNSKLTQTGVKPLSPAYAAPEQLLGQAISTSTDVYAIGLVLYELLTGQLPIQQGENPESLMARNFDHETIDPPSQALKKASDQQRHTTYGRAAADWRAHVAEIKGDLDVIVLHALRREPEHRYRSVAAFADDIKRHLQGLPINARQGHLSYRMNKFMRRNRLKFSAAMAVFCALAVGLAVAVWQAKSASEQARRADEQAKSALAHAQRTAMVKEALVSMFRASGAKALDNPVLGLREILAEGRRQVDDPNALEPLARADLAEALARIHLNSGLPELSLHLAKVSQQIRSQALGSDAAPTQLVRMVQARTLMALGRRDEARALKDELLPWVKRNLGELIDSDPALSFEFAMLAMQLGDTERGFDLLKSLNAISEKRLGKDAAPNVEISARLAELSREKGDYDQALSLLGALMKKAAAGGGEDARYLDLQGRYADTLVEAGRLEEAVAAYQAIIAQEMDYYGGMSSHTLEMLLGLAQCYLLLGDGTWLENTLLRVEESVNSNDLFAAKARFLRAEDAFRRGFFQYSLRIYRVGLELLKEALGPKHPLIWQTQARMAYVESFLTPDPAIGTRFAQIAEQLDAFLGPHNSLGSRVRIDQADTLLRLDESIAAKKLLAQLLGTPAFAAAKGKNPLVARIHLLFAQLFLDYDPGNSDQTEKHLEAASEFLPSDYARLPLGLELMLAKVQFSIARGDKEKAREMVQSLRAMREPVAAAYLAPRLKRYLKALGGAGK